MESSSVTNSAATVPEPAIGDAEGEEVATGRLKPRAASEREGPTRLLLAHRGFVSDERVVLKRGKRVERGL